MRRSALPVVLVLFALAIAPARADEAAEKSTLCFDSEAEAGQRVAACTWLLEPGQGDQAARAHYLNSRGVAFHDQGRFDLAIRDFDECIRQAPEFAVAYANRGVAYAGRWDFPRAAAEFDRAVRLDAAMIWYYNSLAWRLATSADRDRRDAGWAVILAEKAVRLRPAGAFVDTLAAAYAAADRFGDAAREQERALALARVETGWSEADLAALEARLELYRRRRPYREE